MHNEVLEDSLLLFCEDNCPQCVLAVEILNSMDLKLPVNEIKKCGATELAKRFAVNSVPVLIVIKDNEEYDRIYGTKNLSMLDNIFKELNL